MLLLLIPSWADLAGWGGVFAASLALMGLGRLLCGERALPEIALVAGWGAACLVLTGGGVLGAGSLRPPGYVLLCLGAIGLVARGRRLRREEWRALWRLLVVALPLLLVMASVRPSQPDTFLNLLPNAAYLYDHGVFPADDRWPSHSLLPGAPYNMQLAAFLAALLTGDFPASAMIELNIVLQLAFVLLLARVLGRTEHESLATPGWSAVALALLLATALNPGFVPRYHLSAYSEPSVTVALALSAWLVAVVLGRVAARESYFGMAVALALSLAALISIKQDSVALAAGLVASSLLLILATPSPERSRAVGTVILCALPALALYGVWRWYVLVHFSVGELKPLPLSEWQLGNLPQIVVSMGFVVWQKPLLFAGMLAAILGLSWHWRHHSCDRATRVAALLIGVALIYNAALLAAYVGHFSGQMSAEAHSYFRYNTHLALLLVLALTLLARDAVLGAMRRLGDGARRLAPSLVVLATALAPFVFFIYLRFDLEAPALRAWQVAALGAQALGQDPGLALILPQDNGSVATMLDAALRFVPPRHPDAALEMVAQLAPGTLAEIAAKGTRFALISCTPSGIPGVPPGQAVLLAREQGQWRPAARLSYDAPFFRHWSHVLAEPPLCLGGGD